MLRLRLNPNYCYLCLCQHSIRSFNTTKGPYDILGIPSNATKAEIKKAYIDKAKKCHPDLFPDDEAKTEEFQEVQKAYEILSDTRKRAEYAQQMRQQHDPNSGSPGMRHPFDTRQSQGHPFQQNPNPFDQRYNQQTQREQYEAFHKMFRQSYERRSSGSSEPTKPKESAERGKRWDIVLVRFFIAYLICTLIVANFRLSHARQMDENTESRQLQNMGATRMLAQQREAKKRQQEVKELMEEYYNVKVDDTVGEILEDEVDNKK